MAKKKGGKKEGHRSSHRKSNPKKGHHRRRRNPDTFGSRLIRMAGMGAAAIGTGVAVYWGAGQLQATHPNVAMYGLPLAGLALGAAVARKSPMLGVGVGVGAVAPLAVPVAAKVLSPSSTSSTAALGRAARTLRAIDMGRARMGAVDMRGLGAVDMHGYY